MQNRYLQREILASLKEELANHKILILLGARQVGKTTLMNELEEYLLNDDKKVQFYNLEIPDDSLVFSEEPSLLFKRLTKNTDYVFIDEFQYYQNATKLFKAIYDDKKSKVKIIASGSSSLDMHKHLSESLAGRKVEYLIYPLSFREFQQSRNSFQDYLVYGANPELIHIKDKNKQAQYLKGLVATYIMKDIKALIKEENVTAFNALLYYLADNQGQLISSNSLANELKISNFSVEKYLEILSQTYILHRINSYSANLSNELKKSKKYYYYDTGIRNSIINDLSVLQSRRDKGSIYEQYVCNFLVKNSPPNSELRFWRTRNGDEIDFVFIKNRKPYIFEVKSRLFSDSIPDAMKIFVRNYPNTQAAFVINETLSTELEYRGVTVRFVKIEDIEKDLGLREVLAL
jgi:uncharacterized protein